MLLDFGLSIGPPNLDDFFFVSDLCCSIDALPIHDFSKSDKYLDNFVFVSIVNDCMIFITCIPFSRPANIIRPYLCILWGFC